jgi:gluconolactonase
MTRPFIVLQSAFHQLVSPAARLERIAAGYLFSEGPVWRGDHLLFSDIPRSRIVRWQGSAAGSEVTTFRMEMTAGADRQADGQSNEEGPAAPLGPAETRWNTGQCNGMTLDRENRLIVCGHGARRLTRTEHDGTITVLADRFESKRLNSPNDVVLHRSGALYFTDPPWGLEQQRVGKELPYQGVFRLAIDGNLSLLSDEMQHPNGLAFSPDQSLLYVGDDATGVIHVFDVLASGALANRRRFAEIPLPSPLGPDDGSPDGVKTDSEGNVYVATIGGVWIFRPDGLLLGILSTPEVPGNLAWGGQDWRTLFITATTSVYRISMSVAGIPVGSELARS